MTTLHRPDLKPVDYDYPLPVVQTYDTDKSFNVSFFTNNAVSPVRVKDGTSGKSIYVTDVILSGGGASRVDLIDADETSVLTIFMGASNPFRHHFATPKKVVVSKDLNVRTPNAVGLAVSVDGYVK